MYVSPIACTFFSFYRTKHIGLLVYPLERSAFCKVVTCWMCFRDLQDNAFKMFTPRGSKKNSRAKYYIRYKFAAHFNNSLLFTISLARNNNNNNNRNNWNNINNTSSNWIVWMSKRVSKEIKNWLYLLISCIQYHDEECNRWKCNVPISTTNWIFAFSLKMLAVFNISTVFKFNYSI